MARSYEDLSNVEVSGRSVYGCLLGFRLKGGGSCTIIVKPLRA